MARPAMLTTIISITAVRISPPSTADQRDNRKIQEIMPMLLAES